MVKDNKKKKDKCAAAKKKAFFSGRRAGFWAGRNKYSEEELQRAPRVFSEGLAVLKGMGATAARRSSKAQLIVYIINH
jgi:hypothetical protein